jgi:hypothetical protein
MDNFYHRLSELGSNIDWTFLIDGGICKFV